MKAQAWRAALLVGTSILAVVSATRRTSQLRPDLKVPEIKGRNVVRHKIEKRASDLQFYDNSTAPYFVESLPDIPQDYMTEMYSGLIPIDMNNASRALFFVFQPTIAEPVDEVTIWLNGGPGCSSLEGFLQENGRILWSWGMLSPVLNPYSWINLTNVLWVEQPVGTGFSIGEVTATNEEDIAEDFVNFFKNFETIFGIKNFNIYVTGESYAGRYVPYIGNAMLDRNDTEYFNLSGAINYDPVIGSFDYVQNQVPAVPYVVQNNNNFGFNASFLEQLEASHESCGYAAFLDQYLTFPPSGMQPPEYFNHTSEADCDLWGLVYQTAYATNPCFNPYETSLQCPMQGDPLWYPSDIIYAYPGIPLYFNRTDVKVAMHAPLDVSWFECNGPVFVGDGGPEGYDDTSPDPIQGVLPRIIEATNRVLVANGALDFEIITNGTLLAIQNMTWGGEMGFQEAPSTPIYITLPDLMYEAAFDYTGFVGWDDPQGTMGVQHYERGLMFASTNLCGHMQPQFQPRSSYRHVQWMLGRIDEL